MVTSALLLLASLSPAHPNSLKPIVAIMSHGRTKSSSPLCKPSCDVIEASYVKWIESAGTIILRCCVRCAQPCFPDTQYTSAAASPRSGGRAVAVPYDATDAQVDMLFKSTNGLLLPGGASDISDAAKRFLGLAKEGNSGGADYYPVWGTCLGFEWMLQFEGGANALDSGFDSENITLPVSFTPAGEVSRMFSGKGNHTVAYQCSAIRSIFSDAGNPVAMNNHESGITPADFAANTALSAFYDVISTNVDRKDRAFVSAMEAKDPRMPFYGVQYHPEKSQYEFGQSVWSGEGSESPYEVINHSREAVLASQFLADFFVGECRRNDHTFASAAAEQASLMYNYADRIGTGDAPEFVQTYYLKH